MLSVFVRHSTADALPMVSVWLTVALQLWTGEWDGAIHIRDMLRADVIGTLSGPPVRSRLGHRLQRISSSVHSATCDLRDATAM
jgi:hypothetical protein